MSVYWFEKSPLSLGADVLKAYDEPAHSSGRMYRRWLLSQREYREWSKHLTLNRMLVSGIAHRFADAASEEYHELEKSSGGRPEVTLEVLALATARIFPGLPVKLAKLTVGEIAEVVRRVPSWFFGNIHRNEVASRNDIITGLHDNEHKRLRQQFGSDWLVWHLVASIWFEKLNPGARLGDAPVTLLEEYADGTGGQNGPRWSQATNISAYRPNMWSMSAVSRMIVELVELGIPFDQLIPYLNVAQKMRPADVGLLIANGVTADMANALN